MKLKSNLLLTLAGLLSTVLIWATPLQQKTKEHKVTKGETLYSISKKYNISVDELKKANNGNSAVNVGQIILIPIKGVDEPKASTSKSTSHVVKAGETLYSISRDHDVSVSDIKKWNHLASNELNVGQEITLKETTKTAETTSTHSTSSPSNTKTHVVKAGETLYSISHDLNIEVSDLKKWNHLTSNELNVGQELKLTANHTAAPVGEVKPKETTKPIETKETPVATPKVVNKPTQTVFAKSSAQKKYDRIAENGKAKVVSSSILDSKFSYCMHPTAPIGTVIKVMNADNGNYIYARVMGNDSQTGFLILVNKTVKERLQNSNSEFSVKISFVK